MKKLIKSLLCKDGYISVPHILPACILRLLLFVLDCPKPTAWITTRAFLLALAGAKIGWGSKVYGQFFCSEPTALRFGSDMGLACGARIYVRKGQIFEIGDETFIGPELLVLSDTHEIGQGRKRCGEGVWKSVKVGSGNWIGARVTLLPGVTIGDSNMIAAGAVVSSSFGDNQFIGGVPAKTIKGL